MFIRGVLGFVFFVGFCAKAQNPTTDNVVKKIAPNQDTVFIDNKNINPKTLIIKNQKGEILSNTLYSFNKSLGTIYFNKKSSDTLLVSYSLYPEFLTKEYSNYNTNAVVSNQATQTVKIKEDKKNNLFVPFEGIATTGSISRGLTVGNNQNAVVNSNLDLQLNGKISDNITLRASIQDSNVPLQEGGYSQKLDEFDQIFIEILAKQWQIRAGDLFLEDKTSRFMPFNKKVQGISSAFSWQNSNSKTNAFLSGAIVRGQYARSNFVGQEGNQGPYKLIGNNGALYVLIISGSEKVYVNGILKQRGEDKDYIIDYNAGELIFTTLFPITSEMRISIEYQYSDRNFTRFVTHNGFNFKNDKWTFSSSFYNENDIKNQPLQQNLSAEQIDILQDAGDNTALMVAPSANAVPYSENKILYKKTIIGGTEVFEYSNNSNDELYEVKFTLVGNNNGNYILSNTQAIGKIYSYVAPISGVKQGNYEPVTKLISPFKIQVANFTASYEPSEKTKINTEFAISNKDENLYSSLDDDNNKGIAAVLKINQEVFKTENSSLRSLSNFQIINKNFSAIERLYPIEFNRNWNISLINFNHTFFQTAINYAITSKGFFSYAFEKLDFNNYFSGNKHTFLVKYRHNRFQVFQSSSLMNGNEINKNSTFFTNQSKVTYSFSKNYIGATLRAENNKEKEKNTQLFTANSQKFIENGFFAGRGDTTKIFTELGFLYRANDSLQNNAIERVNNSNSFYVKSQLIKKENTQLSCFSNYRILKFSNGNASEKSLQSRIIYNDVFFDKILQSNLSYETLSGTVALQEFTYIEVEPGQGVYAWNDYNQNGIQELDEFDIAPFQDLAKYVKVFLPNQNFRQTHQNKFSGLLNFNFSAWQNSDAVKKIISHFQNQTSVLIDKKVFKESDSFFLNLFNHNEENIASLQYNFRNSLFYNKGKQKHSVTYTFSSNQSKQLLLGGNVSQKIASNIIQYLHLIKKQWLVSSELDKTIQEANSNDFTSRNYTINQWKSNIKLSYLFNANTHLDASYQLGKKENTYSNAEFLEQQVLGISFFTVSKKAFSFNANFNFYRNSFIGNATNAVAFQMLEGLQPGKNITWSLNLQKNITKYLDVNMSYIGRKSENINTIHTGSIQLRAFF